MGFWRRIFGPGRGHGVAELARRLGVTEGELRALKPTYTAFTIPKRSGGVRRILAPSRELKDMQRRVLRRLLSRLRVHPCATGFERGHSIVTNANYHKRKALVVRMDVKDFFTSTRAKTVQRFFRAVGWNRDAAEILVRLCTYEEGLPQGAPTSPRLSNLANHHLDARLAGLARYFGGAYTRYADDLIFSFEEDLHEKYGLLILAAKGVLERAGYQLHMKRKLHIRRRHQRQVVTGLVVNERVALPRETRRWLRAVEHRARAGGQPTLSPSQLAGWRAFQSMVATQRDALPG